MDRLEALRVAVQLAYDTSDGETWDLLGKKVRQEITPSERRRLNDLEALRVYAVRVMEGCK